VSNHDDPFREASLSVDAWGHLTYIDSSGRKFESVEPVRAFPLSDPDHWVALVDKTGHELALFEDLDATPFAFRQILTEELQRREFVPKVNRILQVRGEVPSCIWVVETDRGRAEIPISEEDQVRRLGTNGVLIIDDRGLHYLIPDSKRLDAASRRHLEQFV
jgi:hypothetical protein